MATILQQCPSCKVRQSLKNKNCKCGYNLAREKRKNYWVFWREDGKTKEKLIKYNLESAREFQRNVESSLVKGEHIELDKGKTTTLKQLFDWYLELASTKEKASWVRDRQYSVNLLRLLGDSTKINDLTTGRLEEYQFTRAKEDSPTKKGSKTASATVDKELQMLRASINKAIEHGRLTKKPFIRLPQHRADNQRDRVLSHEEYDRLLENLPAWLKAPVQVAYCLGMRQDEIFSLTWDKVDMKTRIIRLEPKDVKERKTRLIPVMDGVFSVFQGLPRGLKTDRVFLKDGKPFGFTTNIETRWKQALKDSEIDDFRFHDLRHTAITRMVIEGYPVDFIMRVTGHTNFKTHSRYTNLNAQALWQIIERKKAIG
ncbi:MAG: site-specific integrase [SAR324 cluster bacterium]|nr:site-specific integrase [SAR324 cluster bacterium]